MLDIKAKIYPSSSGFREGSIVYTDYDSGCYRSIGYKALGVQVPFDNKTAQVGATNEDLYEKALTGTIPYEREKVFTTDLGDGITLSGRIDFVTDFAVIELKSTRSYSKRTNLRAGRVTTENVAQLVAYMVALERVTGELRYTYYDEKKETKEDYNFTVNILENGSVTLNGELYRYDVHSYLSHRAGAVRLIRALLSGSSSALYDAGRPNRWNDKFNSPCNYCPFKLACEKLDKEGPTELERSKQLAIESVHIIKGVSK